MKPYKIKTLSPAISAFQFQGNQSPKSPRSPVPKSPASKSGDYFNQDYYSFAPTTELVNTDQEDSYVYKNKVCKVDQETKEKLLGMGVLPLETEWTFWFDKFVPNLPAEEYEANLRVISHVNTVQKFWSVYNNIDGPEKLGFRSNYHFMKKGIKPIWEDPMNEYGGSYNFKISKQFTHIAWRDILILLIGENLDDQIKNIVYGVSISCRQHCDNIQIWTGHNNAKMTDQQVKMVLTDLLYPTEIHSLYFKMHKSHADFKPSTPTTPTTPTLSFKGFEKITKESIERVVQDIKKIEVK